ncbi:MAG: SH3 domain-containing protein [Devosia sp.]
MRYFSRLLTTLAGIMLLAMAPAFALSEAGTHAWSTSTLTLRAGPGLAYTVTGEIAADLPIKVLRCEELWCVVDGDGGRGWTSKQSIVFGLTSTDWPGGVNPDYPTGGSICFYSGTNFTGSELCLGSGRVIHDLALLGLDNSFNSVRVHGASAAACRDRGFQSYCERIIADQPVLDQYLRHALSSIRVY